MGSGNQITSLLSDRGTQIVRGLAFAQLQMEKIDVHLKSVASHSISFRRGYRRWQFNVRVWRRD